MDEMTNEQYSQYISSISPKTQCGKNMLFAFLVGGGICTIGQAVLNFYTAQGLDPDAAGSAVCITMIALGALLTGLGVYDKLANIAGAGTLVPITGFANCGIPRSGIQNRRLCHRHRSKNVHHQRPCDCIWALRKRGVWVSILDFTNHINRGDPIGIAS